MKNSISLTRGLLPLFGLAAFITFWQLISGFYSHVVVPSPAEVAQTLWTLAAGGELWEQSRHSILRGLLGFCLAVAAGTPLGLLIGLNPVAASLLRPCGRTAGDSAISWLLLAMIWIGFSRVPVFVVFVTTVPLIVINTYQS